MNTELLLKVKAAILAEPRQFDMDAWFITNPKNIPNCGTAACIASWAVVLGNNQTQPRLKADILFEKKKQDYQTAGFTKEFDPNLYRIEAGNIYYEGKDILDLTDGQAMILFHVCNWPSQFRDAYEHSSTPTSRAQVAADRIDFFIANKQ